MAKIRITQVKSGIDRPERQKRTLTALGIRKMNVPVEHEATPQIKGMVDKVKHLLSVEEIAEQKKTRKKTEEITPENESE